MKQNFQLLMEQTIAELDHAFTAEAPPRLMLHSCCAPCSSSVIKRLAGYFKLTVFYYNPNIDTQLEYHTRADEQIRLIEQYNGSMAFPYQFDYVIR